MPSNNYTGYKTFFRKKLKICMYKYSSHEHKWLIKYQIVIWLKRTQFAYADLASNVYVR